MQEDILIVNKGLLDINPLMCGEERCEAGHIFGPASRSFYLIHYVLSGNGTLTIDKKVYPIGKGQIFITRPYEISSYQADLVNPWHYCWIGFAASLDLGHILSQDVMDGKECKYIFNSLRECKHLEVSREYYMCSKIYELISLLEQRNTTSQIDAHRYALAAKNYIETNYVNAITVDKIATYLNLNRSYLSRIFKQNMGQSPQHYIVEYRLNKAAELIVFHGYKTNEAAMSTGYHNISNFCKMFKSRFGVSPKNITHKDLLQTSSDTTFSCIDHTDI